MSVFTQYRYKILTLLAVPTLFGSTDFLVCLEDSLAKPISSEKMIHLSYVKLAFFMVHLNFITITKLCSLG